MTDDFAVLAVDLELSHLGDNLRRSVPRPLREILAARGLV